ncbi:MAG: hypothetical protein JXX14_13565 [Deltaproteobacteria bacterium]|nr:hypothetical protein [Deltaproteobacteria bacterium]
MNHSRFKDIAGTGFVGKNRRRFLGMLGFLIVGIVLFQGKSIQAESPDDILIIVHTSVKISSISLADVRRIFLKQKASLAGQTIIPINARKDSALRRQFTQKVFGKSSAEEQSYWEQQKIKSGLRPPNELSDTIRAIFSSKNAISYCYRKDYAAGVAKIILVL